VALFLFLLLFPRIKGWRGIGVLVMVLSVWALAAEAEFILIVLGLLATTIMIRLWSDTRLWRAEGFPILASALPAVLISLIQGGTITEIARSIVAGRPSIPGGSAALFSLRLPLAIVSSHLGELRLDRPDQLLVGLAEIGPIILAGPLVVWASIRWFRRGRYGRVSLAVASYLGFLIPIFLRYNVDRDITRLSGSGLLDWALLAVPAVWILWPRLRSAWLKAGISAIAGASLFAGVVVLGPLLTAISRPMLSNEIAVVDAAMTRRFWDKLEPGGLVLDSRGWRAVAVTGRLTRSAVDVTNDLPSWREVVAAPDLDRVAQAGFSYVYVDKIWWDRMTEAERESYSRPCVILVGEETDNNANGLRRLYDIRACLDGP
jgi:hypothetical protein